MPIERKLVDYDPATGVKEEYVVDHAENVVRLINTEDAGALLEGAAAIRSTYDTSKAIRDGAVTVAKLTPLMVLELMKIGIMDRGYRIRDEAAFYIWLENHNKFKIAEGRI